MQVFCVDESVSNIVQIRIRLSGFQFSKSQRKLLAKNGRIFRVVYSAQTDNSAEKEELYRLHDKKMYRGAVFHSLADVTAGLNESALVKEFRVYHGERLVALSYFEEGNTAVASLMGLFDPEYSKYSLGTYTMLLELQRSLAEGRKYYYPGYLMDSTPIFHYKLNLAPPQNWQFYNWRGRWRAFRHLPNTEFPAKQVGKKMEIARKILDKAGVAYTHKFNPWYTIAYTPGIFMYTCAPEMIILPSGQADNTNLTLEYIWETDTYLISRTEEYNFWPMERTFEMSVDYSSEHFVRNPLVYSQKLRVCKDPGGILLYLAENLN